jgi:hypothetical protein
MVTSATVTFETLFELGRLLASPRVLAALAEANSNAVAGDWGPLDVLDMKANAEALKNGERTMSAYSLSTGVKIWIITEAILMERATGRWLSFCC